MARTYTYLGSQIGVETTAGTAVPADTSLRNLTVILKPVYGTETFRPQGYAYDTSSIVVKQESEGEIEGPLSYDEIGYVLASAYGVPVSDEVEAGFAYEHTFAPDTVEATNSRASWTVQFGDSAGAQQAAGCFVSSFEYSIERGSSDGKADFKAAFVGRAITTTTLTASPTETAGHRVSPLKVSVKAASSRAGLTGASALNSVTAVGFKADNLAENVHTVNAANSSASTTVVGDTSREFTITAFSDATTDAWVANLTAACNTPLYFRVSATGSPCGGGTTDYSIQHDIAVRLTEVSELKDVEKVIGYDFKFTPIVDSDGFAEEIILTNAVTEY